MAFLELIIENEGLHLHNYYANTHLFKKFIAKFIADSEETGRKRER